MVTKSLILLVEEEIARLELVRKLLSREDDGGNYVAVAGKVGKKAAGGGRPALSPEARERIASAQRKRWAAQKKAAKKAGKP